ncbi:ABC transporter substrate-binding protein [Streptomyces sp. NPDC002851]
MSGPLQPPSPGPGRGPGSPPEPPPAPRSRRRHLRWAVPAGVLLLYALYFFAGSSWGTRAYWFDRCAEGVWEEGPHDECVGVTDGSHPFDDSLADITRLIHEENKDVEESGKPWVAVAYVHPMTTDDTGRDDNSARQELEGAYLAQHALNRSAEGGMGDEPQIKLLLANPGAGARQWEPLTDRLIDMKDDERHKLVAVTGFGPSFDATGDAVDRLRKAELPLIGAASTADELTNKGKIGFFRVVNPNKGEAFAAARHLKEIQRKESGYRIGVVKDRSDTDLYPVSLYNGFTEAAKEQGLDLDLRLEYSSDADALTNAFASIAERVCRDRPDALYFAGRGRELRLFITAMGAFGQRCPVTVFTGDDAVSMYSDIQESTEQLNKFTERWKLSQVRVRFTAVAHPDLWRGGYPGGKQDPMPEFTKRYLRLTGQPANRLDDGQVIAVHDAMLIAGSAIRDAGPKNATSGAVLQMMLQIKEGNEVPALSGPIYFGDDGDPVAKRVPIVELEPSGAYTFWKGVQP